MLVTSCRTQKVIEVGREVKIDTIPYFLPENVITHSFKVDTITHYTLTKDKTKLVIQRFDSVMQVECKTMEDTIFIPQKTETIVIEKVPQKYLYAGTGVLVTILIMFAAILILRK